MDKRARNWEYEVSALAVKAMGREVLAMDVSKIEVPEALQERVKAFFHEENGRARRKLVRRRFAVILIAAIVAILSACAIIPAVRDRIYSIVIEFYEEYFSYKSEPEPTVLESDVEVFVKRTPSYLPEGYEVQTDISSNNVTSIFYWNSHNESGITYEQFLIGRYTYKGNSEESEIRSVSIGGYEGILMIEQAVSGHEVVVIWNDGQYDYFLVTKLTPDESIRIAESVK